MRSLFLALVVLSCLKVSGQSISSKDSLQILEIINEWNKAWETKDFVLAAKGYSHDARFTNAFGDKCNGQNEVQALLKEVFALPFVMSGKSETTEHRYQVLSNTCVIVHTAVIRKGQKAPDGTLMPDRQTSHIRVFQKSVDEWMINAHLISDARDKQAPKH